MEAALAANDGKEYDLSICCVNIESCEMSAILPVHDDGLVYFFSMATSFTKAALGAEGIGKDVTMIIGNGYTKNHAQITLDVLRENPKLRSCSTRSTAKRSTRVQGGRVSGLPALALSIFWNPFLLRRLKYEDSQWSVRRCPRKSVE